MNTLFSILFGFKALNTINKLKRGKVKKLKKGLFFISSLVVELSVLLTNILIFIFKNIKHIYKFTLNKINPTEVLSEIEENTNIVDIADYRDKKLNRA